MEHTRQAYYDIEDFPQLHEMCKEWEMIRDEFKELTTTVMDIHRIDKTHEEVFLEIVEYLQKGNKFGWMLGWGEDGGNRDWIQYGLIINDMKSPFLELEAGMEKTVALFDDMKGIRACALSKLNPYTVLHTHTHDYMRDEGILQLHLPIETAKEKNYNYFNVMGEFRQWVCGVPIVFDGSLDHFALNESSEPRTVLYVEFQKDMLIKKR